MPERTVTIRNKAGIHCRPSSCIMMEAGKYPQVRFHLTSANGDSDLGSILELLSLGLQKGHTACLSAEGPDADAALKSVGDLFEKEFDFPKE